MAPRIVEDLIAEALRSIVRHPLKFPLFYELQRIHSLPSCGPPIVLAIDLPLPQRPGTRVRGRSGIARPRDNFLMRIFNRD
jgi:hypothetical protein